MSNLLSWLSNSGLQIAAQEADQKVRFKYPLLLHPEETLELAFKHEFDGREKTYFTNRRILLQRANGIGSKRKNYQSIPYTHIEAFSVTTAGVWDCDMELHVFLRGFDRLRVDLSASSVDSLVLIQYMNAKINWSTSDEKPWDQVDGMIPAVAFDRREKTAQQKGWDTFQDWFTNNNTRVNPVHVQHQFATEFPILLDGENIDSAFRSGRDTSMLTSQRVIYVDPKGLFGKKIRFSFYAWHCFAAFAVKTAGRWFDCDSELKLYTHWKSISEVKFDFWKEDVNLMEVNTYVGHRLLGGGSGQPKALDIPEHRSEEGNESWLTNNKRPIDPVEMTRYYKNTVPLLQADEVVEFAFKGYRDIVLFTPQRIIDIDIKGWSGKKIEYTSIPWKVVTAFGVKTAGHYMPDFDAEVRIWTNMMHDFSEGDDPEPIPGVAFLEFDLNKNFVDVVELKRYLSERIFCDSDHIVIPQNTMRDEKTESGLEGFFTWIGSDHQAIDPTTINVELHTNCPILIDGEQVVMAFQCGRDYILFTNKRIVELDSQGWSGKKIAYTSLPYDMIRAFSTESAGRWDRDSEVKIYTRNMWKMEKWNLDFRKGKADILTIQKFLAAIVLGTADDVADYLESSETNTTVVRDPALTRKNAIAWITNNSTQVDADILDSKLHFDPPILLAGEKVTKAFKQGRDHMMYTTHRILKIDVQGLNGKKIEYKSYPWKWVVGFEVETAGHLDRDAEVYLYFDVPSAKKIKQSILVKESDIMMMHRYLSDLMLFQGKKETDSWTTFQ